MFTGIIKDIGKIAGVTPNQEGVIFEIVSDKLISEIAVDDSVSINGACQTAIEVGKNSFKVQTVKGTLEKTTLGKMRAGELVNLELALKVQDRLGGHLVQGHVNDIAPICRADRFGDNYLLTIKLCDKHARYVVKEGSITIEGISLTVFDLSEDGLVTLSIIPHTWFNTILHNKKMGDLVNVEVDILAKYVEKLLIPQKNKKPITAEWLQSKGF